MVVQGQCQPATAKFVIAKVRVRARVSVSVRIRVWL